ncbi:MAG TPA: chemotaxis response regulator protein-glutamate methylesterase [Spirochaetota bacterium]|nr:chemotaxis response regulator protein-glutamate methylesterase [Spirochaetota bacterium]HOL57711.1 chemotaxis response regulator protein-glutamate methylesterase [Spirochaetota bacterium]HPP05688.1 chemotaxis response regulator protein-glutamate methylesterase [Spirochaetota bacterium]
MEKIKVLVVDDSAIVRDILSSEIEKQSDMELVGTAPDPYIARDKIVRLNPDVVTLDIEMPRMDGLTFLEKLMYYNPLPVIIVSSVTTKDNLAAIKALELGAFDVVNKPGGSISVEQVKEDVLFKIRSAYKNREDFLTKWKILNKEIGKVKRTRHILTEIKTTEKLIAIGSSTGGTVALEYIFSNLPKHLPPIVVVQHMPEIFTFQFAKRLNELSELNIKEAEDSELVEVGNVYIAPGGKHMGLKRIGASLFIELITGEKIHFQRPAVDPLFERVAKNVGINALGILLTGMGKDGAMGLLKIKESGGYTIAQDEKTSVVWGMPKAAIDLNAAMEILPLDKIIDRIIDFAKK